MVKSKLGVIETLLNDGVVIFQEDLKIIETRLIQNPDLITDIIKVHELAQDCEDIVVKEYIYPTEKGIVYELHTFGVEEAIQLSFEVDMLNIKSKNLVIGIAYPMEVNTDEGD